MTKAELKLAAQTIKAIEYTESRAYLAAVLAAVKAKDPSYSFTRFSEDLGVGSKNAHGILNGKRPLTLKTAEGIVDALGITGLQKRFFLCTVKLERSRSVEEREAAFQERLALIHKELPTELDRRQLAFFEQWHHAAILEILRLEGASDSAEWIAHMIKPEVPLHKIRESLKLLQELGYLTLDPQRSRLYPSDALIRTGDQVLSMAILSFHRQMLKLAMDALDTIPREDRDISAVTLSVSPELREQLTQEIVALRKRFVRLSVEQNSPSEVVQVNFQIFPLVKMEG